MGKIPAYFKHLWEYWQTCVIVSVVVMHFFNIVEFFSYFLKKCHFDLYGKIQANF